MTSIATSSPCAPIFPQAVLASLLPALQTNDFKMARGLRITFSDVADAKSPVVVKRAPAGWRFVDRSFRFFAEH